MNKKRDFESERSENIKKIQESINRDQESLRELQLRTPFVKDAIRNVFTNPGCGGILLIIFSVSSIIGTLCLATGIILFVMIMLVGYQEKSIEILPVAFIMLLPVIFLLSNAIVWLVVLYFYGKNKAKNERTHRLEAIKLSIQTNEMRLTETKRMSLAEWRDSVLNAERQAKRNYSSDSSGESSRDNDSSSNLHMSLEEHNYWSKHLSPYDNDDD